MNSSSHLESIFNSALERGAEERAAFLDEACAGDEALRRRLELMLEAHAGGFLSAPHAEVAVTQPFPITEGPGAIVGPYRLMEQIGEGGFGLVFVAEQQKPVRRRVALKIIKPGMDTREVIARFEAERQALALMDHPNIARVLDAGATDSGRPYFVMELVKGIPITDYCDQQQLAAPERLMLFVSVCHAVQHAHSKGVIHRDLKPTNILVAPHDGLPVVKVIDFGVAKAIGQQLTEKTIYTRFAQMIGTPLYMSPEQAEINALDVDIRSDVYSLGVLLYELLTGTTPFDRQRFATAAYDEIRRIIKEEEPPKPSTRLSTLGNALAAISAMRRMEPTKLSALVRGDLDWIVMRCLEKDRSRRYETANDLARDIERYLHDEPVDAGPPTARYKLKKLARRYRKALTTAVAFLLILILGSVVATWQAIRATRAERDLTVQRNAAVANEQKALIAAEQEQQAKEVAEAERDAKDKALARAEGLRLTAQSTVELANDPGLALLLAIEAAERISGLESNNALLAALDVCNEERTLYGHTGRVQSAEFTPDGNRIMSCADDGTVRFWDVESGRQLYAAQVGPSNAATSAILSPDGKFFVARTEGITTYSWRNGQSVAYTDRVLRACDAATGNQLAILRGHEGGVRTAVFSADSKRLVTASMDTTARVWEIPSGKQLAVLSGHVLAPYSARFSPDGSQILTVSSRYSDRPLGQTILRAEIVDPDEIRVPAQDEFAERSSSKGQSYSSIDEREKLLARVWDAETGNDLMSVLRPKGLFGAITELPYYGHFSPDGRRVAFGFSHEAQVWDVAAGKRLFHIKDGGVSGRPTNLAWSPDGKRLSTIQGYSASIWDASDGSELSTLRGHEGGLLSVAFSADGKSVITTSADRTARVWNADAGETVAGFKGHASSPNSAVISPDGQRVVTASSDGTVRLWRMNQPRDHARPLAMPIGNFKAMAFSPDGRYIATCARYDLSPRIWDTATGTLFHALKPDLKGVRHVDTDWYGAEDVWGVTFSPDGTRLLTIGNEGKIRIRKSTLFGLIESGEEDELPFTPVRLWDVATGKQLAALPGGEWHVQFASFSPDGRKVLTAETNKQDEQLYSGVGGLIQSLGGVAEGDEETFVRVYDAVTGSELFKLPHVGPIDHAVFSPDGKRVLTSAEPSFYFHVWDAESRRKLFDLERRDQNALAVFSPDGTTIFVLEDPTIRAFDAQGGKQLAAFDSSVFPSFDRQLGNAGFSPFSPDGKTLYASDGYGLVLLDANSGKQRVTFRGHSGSVSSALFSADGRYLVTGSDDQSARIWDVATGKELHTLRHKDGVEFAVMSADGSMVATASDTVRIWRLNPLSLAIRRKPRELTEGERIRFSAPSPTLQSEMK